MSMHHFGLHSQVFLGLVSQVPVLIVGVPKVGYRLSLLREKIQDLSSQLWVTVPGMEFVAEMYLCLYYPLLLWSPFTYLIPRDFSPIFNFLIFFQRKLFHTQM